MPSDTASVIRKIALKNAHDYGKASVSAVLGKLLSAAPESKADIKKAEEMVKKVVAEVNSLSKDELEEEFKSYAEEFKSAEKEKEERSSKPRMELEGAVAGSFATRFPPEPNGYMHIGHAKAAFLESEFAKIYKGNLFLYFDDTNPESERQEFADAIKRDLQWLGIKFDKEYYASDNLEMQYKYAEKLIREGNAYVCSCTKEEMQKDRMSGTECIHRKQGNEENIELWNEMLSGNMDENSAVLRLKGNMKSANTVMRDPVLFRVKRHEHYRQKNKYIVWPTYNFNTPVMDSVYSVTDVIRSKEYELRDELYITLLQMLKLRIPRIHSIARLEIEGNITSKRKLNQLIKQGLLEGYDDPRLITIAALRRRGIAPEAIREFVLRFGMSKANSIVSIDMLLAENRKVVDSRAKRFFMVEEPVPLEVEGIGTTHVKLRMHPDYDLGYREYDVGSSFFISGKDARELSIGDRIRMKDLYNVEILSIGDSISARFIGNESINAKKLQWISADNYTICKIARIGRLMIGDQFNRKSIIESEGYVESAAAGLKEGEIVQFEREGFFKLDRKADQRFISM